ncbi:MAG: DJ-1/PfpI family protein [Cyclobacteriaceae bacterium]
MNAAILLFDGFETLDVFGPVEILGRIKDHYRVKFYSEKGNMISNDHGISIATEKLENIIDGVDIFLIPGGPGTRTEVDNLSLINNIRDICEASGYVLTVCTGSALLAQTGLLNDRQATSNKKAYEWATSFGNNVHWVRQARWTVDGKFYTSSGVSAGMDMTFGFLSDLHGAEFARKIAFQMEYHWQEDKEVDDFYKQ